MMPNKALLLLCLPALALSSCSSGETKTRYIGIISAMDNEINLLLKEAKIKETKIIGDASFHIGTLRGKDVVIAPGGIGKVWASSGITAMLLNFDISKVIFTGIAGGTKDEEKILDEVIATKLVEHDFGSWTNDGFVWGGGDPGKAEEGEYYLCDEALVDLAYNTAASFMGEEAVFKGLIATGDQFIASEAHVNWLVEKFDAYACEMEGAAIAKICTAYDIPFVVLRTLSDKADGAASENYLNFGDLAADQSSRIVVGMLASL